MLSGNAIKTVQSYAFKSLPNLETLLLNGNMIDSIESLAFSGLTNIHKIELQNNRLRYTFLIPVTKLLNCRFSMFHINDTSSLF